MLYILCALLPVLVNTDYVQLFKSNSVAATSDKYTVKHIRLAQVKHNKQ